MLKRDFQKAYDSVVRIYLEAGATLASLHFLDLIVEWIMTCLTTVTYSFALNSFPTPPFAIKRGLRQGYPVPFSYFLFLWTNLIDC